VECKTTGRSRHLADDGRHFTDRAVRFAGIVVGIVTAAPVVIFSVATTAPRRPHPRPARKEHSLRHPTDRTTIHIGQSCRKGLVVTGGVDDLNPGPGPAAPCCS
jgi:hypothetical protein